MKVKNDHRCDFSNLSSWREEAWENLGFNGIRTCASAIPVSRRSRVWILLKPWSIFFSFRLLKLENLRRLSFFTFVYSRSSNMNYFIYTLHGVLYTPLLIRLLICHCQGVPFAIAIHISGRCREVVNVWGQSAGSPLRRRSLGSSCNISPPRTSAEAKGLFN